MRLKLKTIFNIRLNQNITGKERKNGGKGRNFTFLPFLPRLPFLPIRDISPHRNSQMITYTVIGHNCQPEQEAQVRRHARQLADKMRHLSPFAV